MNPPIQLKRKTPVVLVALACFALSPMVQAQLPPPLPDGGYPGGNTAEGIKALINDKVATGTNNTATGFEALTSNTTGSFNTAIGNSALHDNNGNGNTATGAGALRNNQTGKQNTATGAGALRMNTIGEGNTALGFQALLNNTDGFGNAAMGTAALGSNKTGSGNTAIGSGALGLSIFSSANTAIGSNALHKNESGLSSAQGNTAVGASALSGNVDGEFNTAVGNAALSAIISGEQNTAIGEEALGNFDFHAGSKNIAVGSLAGSSLTNGSSNIYIGNEGVAEESVTIRIGSIDQSFTFIAGISGTPVVGDTVVVNADGQLGMEMSAARFKKKIRPMAKTSEAILALKPVSFQYKSDSKGTQRLGLIAEDVANVNPDLVVRDRNGKIYSVRYEAVNAMLLNEFLKEHRKVQELEANAVEQQKQIEVLTAGLQKVSAQIELSKRAPQTVLNNH